MGCCASAPEAAEGRSAPAGGVGEADVVVEVAETAPHRGGAEAKEATFKSETRKEALLRVAEEASVPRHAALLDIAGALDAAGRAPATPRRAAGPRERRLPSNASTAAAAAAAAATALPLADVRPRAESAPAAKQSLADELAARAAEQAEPERLPKGPAEEAGTRAADEAEDEDAEERAAEPSAPPPGPSPHQVGAGGRAGEGAEGQPKKPPARPVSFKVKAPSSSALAARMGAIEAEQGRARSQSETILAERPRPVGGGALAARKAALEEDRVRAESSPVKKPSASPQTGAKLAQRQARAVGQNVAKLLRKAEDEVMEGKARRAATLTSLEELMLHLATEASASRLRAGCSPNGMEAPDLDAARAASLFAQWIDRETFPAAYLELTDFVEAHLPDELPEQCAALRAALITWRDDPAQVRSALEGTLSVAGMHAVNAGAFGPEALDPARRLGSLGVLSGGPADFSDEVERLWRSYVRALQARLPEELRLRVLDTDATQAHALSDALEWRWSAAEGIVSPTATFSRGALQELALEAVK